MTSGPTPSSAATAERAVLDLAVDAEEPGVLAADPEDEASSPTSTLKCGS